MSEARLRAVVAVNIRRFSKHRRYSINRMIDLAGVSRSAVFRALRGDAALTLDTVARLAEVLDTDPARLLLEDALVTHRLEDEGW